MGACWRPGRGEGDAKSRWLGSEQNQEGSCQKHNSDVPLDLCHWARTGEPSSGPWQCKSLACAGCPEPATDIFIHLSFCVVYLGHPPHPISATQPLFAFQNPVPCRLPRGLSGSAPLGCTTRATWLSPQFRELGPHCLPHVTSHVDTRACPQRLMLSWHQMCIQ